MQIQVPFCSDGSEAYSIALGLIDKIGYDNAKEKFSITAIDMKKPLIDLANQGIIGLDYDDHEQISKFAKVSDYFTKLTDEEEKIVREKNPEFNFDYDKNINDISFYKVDDKLRSFVKFKQADVFDHFKEERFQPNSVTFINYAMYILCAQRKSSNFLNFLSSKMQQGNLIIMSNSDYRLADEGYYLKRLTDMKELAILEKKY